ncbi:MAG: class II glutamine amidotransferase [Ruminococcus sp.]|nr:class II glutamine amidotransferase [Ruminococcus sp.]
MCELLGFCSRRPENIKDQLREFYTHSERHPHGWGIMYGGFTDKGVEKASDCKKLKNIVDRLEPQPMLLAHIRFATVGSVKSVNCHPFTQTDNNGRRWTLIHNGTIYSGSRLIKYLSTQAGDTDSERLFMLLLDRINAASKNGELSEKERFELIDDFVREMSPRNKLNLMIYDGDIMYIHKNMSDTMKYRRTEAGYLFATTALDDKDWKSVPTAQLLAYKDGEKIFTGERHDGVFVPTLQYIKAFDAMNI